uniref:Uncharacterized protein n=1 Tax=Triticum urartu TaxID=4572 RepID=A0A8R7PJE6_TRIUA
MLKCMSIPTNQPRKHMKDNQISWVTAVIVEVLTASPAASCPSQSMTTLTSPSRQCGCGLVRRFKCRGRRPELGKKPSTSTLCRPGGRSDNVAAVRAWSGAFWHEESTRKGRRPTS